MSDRAFVCTRKGLFTLRRRGSEWSIDKLDFRSIPVIAMLPDPRDGTLYAAVKSGHFGPKTHRSTDGGETWDEIATPEYPEKPADYPESRPMEGEPSPWKLVMVWSLEAGGRDQPGRIYAGTLPGGLFVSDDRGATWSLDRNLWDHPLRLGWFGGGADHPGIHSVVVDPRDSKRVTIGVSCAGNWLTEDGGQTWRPSSKGMRAEYVPPEQAHEENIQDPHRTVACPSNPDAMWVQHHNGIFKSADGGASWIEIEEAGPSTFGFAVAVHPSDGNTAWFVPGEKDEYRIPVGAQVVVTRTRDGGKSFDVLRKGLPQSNAFDLVYRHALDVDETGDRLMFGSTTGNLWGSEDGGDSWTTIGNHLPPVYAVRFG